MADSDEALMAAGKKYIIHLAADRKCAQCHHTFKLSQNIGQYNCLRHIGIWRPHNNVWTCCNRSFDEAGCARADHSEQEHFFAPSSISVPRLFYARRVVDPVPSVKALVTSPTADSILSTTLMLTFFEYSGMTLGEKMTLVDSCVIVSTYMPPPPKPG